jgi:mRNA interferase MazF
VIRRGDLWWAELPDPAGSGPGYRRPLLILQSDHFNASRIRTIVGLAVTSNRALADMPGCVLVEARESGLDRDSVINGTQIVTIDKRQLGAKAGEVGGEILLAVERAVREVLALI